MPSVARIRALRRELALSGVSDPFELLAEYIARNERLERELDTLRERVKIPCPG